MPCQWCARAAPYSRLWMRAGRRLAAAAAGALLACAHPRGAAMSSAASSSSSSSKTWAELEALGREYKAPDRVNGPTNAQATLRLFGQSEATEATVRVTLFRDHHAWCPYCQKVWLFLEEKQIPYRTRKVTMRCYGKKEPWFSRLVPSGMLPALELDGTVITESDDILAALEEAFGPLGTHGMAHRDVVPLRRLERLLFRAWCAWLCYPQRSADDEERSKIQFAGVAAAVEKELAKTPGPYFLGEELSIADIVFVPYVERMGASLFYYKGYCLRDAHPRLGAWLDALETRATYRGTQSDFHTHSHDLPPQMGGCYSNATPQAAANQRLVDEGPWDGLPDARFDAPPTGRLEAVHRVLRHRQALIKVNPADDEVVAAVLRAALTRLATGAAPTDPLPDKADVAARYLRDRISVPRDMSLHAARCLRQALEATARHSPGGGAAQGPAIPLKHRLDQQRVDFAPPE